MTTANVSMSIPAFIKKIKDSEKRNMQTMTLLLLVDVVFVIIAAIVSIPFSVILPVAAVLFLVIAFFGARAHKYTRMLKKIDARIKQDIEFHRFTRSI